MKNKSIYLVLCTTIFLVNCYRGGAVKTNLTNNSQPVVGTPVGFVSPLKEIEIAKEKADALREKLPNKIDPYGLAWKQYVGWEQRFETLQAQQYEREDKLLKNGQIDLIPGESYSFILDSFCVHGGSYRPLIGDGFQVGKLDGRPKKWLPTILRNYRKLGIDQKDIQVLIWALLVDVRFDDLSDRDQALLLRFYPDAPIRFGNRFAEEKIFSFLSQYTPEPVEKVSDQYQKMRDLVMNRKADFSEFEKVFAPFSPRKKSIPVGWLQTKEGYLLKLTSDNGYNSVQVDIYVPPYLKRNLTFKPEDWIALPETGQRLALSPASHQEQRPAPQWDCNKVKKMFVNNCQPMTDAKRSEILKIADPKNFPQTRYVSPPDRFKSFREETDCSTFTYEIYKEVGYQYPFSTTSAMACLTPFKEVPAKDAKPGDLVLFPGHVGILDDNNKVISATIGGKTKKRSTLPITDPDFLPSITRYRQSEFGEGKVLQWTCP